MSSLQSLNGLGSNNLSYLIAQETQSTSATGSVQSLFVSEGSISSSSGLGSSTPTDSASVSGPGQLYSELSQLQQQDPATFKTLTATIANQISTAAQQTSGGQNQFLTHLASEFQSASQTGSLSALQGLAGGHHHHGGEGTYNASGAVNSSTSSDPISQLFNTIQNEVQQALNPNGSSSSGSSSSDPFSQLFNTIQNEIQQALNPTASSSSGSSSTSGTSSSDPISNLFNTIQNEVNQALHPTSVSA